MPQLMIFEVHSAEESCAKLATLTGWHKPYTRQRLSTLVRKHLPIAEKIGGRYFLKETEIQFLADVIRKERWPKRVK